MTPRRRRVVYTALFGNYEELVEQPMATKTAGVDFVCFSDRPRESDSWRVVVIDLPVPTDPARSARHIKIVGHEVLRTYDEWLWIDNRVVLAGSPADLLDSWLSEHDLAIPLHDHRADVAAEFQAVRRAGFDSSYRVREELAVIRRECPAVLADRPLWTGMIARRPTPAVEEWATRWITMVLVYSRRDQLSVNYAIERSGVKLNLVELDNRLSSLHAWLTIDDLPKNAAARFSPSSGFRYRITDDLFDRFMLSNLGRALRRARRAMR